MFIQDNGSKPFAERVDLATAQEQLLGAAARMRERIDAEFGPFEWDRIDGPTRSSCRDGNNRGGDSINRQGTIHNSGLSDEDFEVAMQIVREEAAVYGFTYEVDVSDDIAFSVNLFNEEDGGHVSVIMNRENRGFSIIYTTGCRPEARRSASDSSS
ncbi:LppA family lipoprotein [Actinobaculum sp. 352]|uniref:LppA family lipoprotein n=1 Tax=Actinobaculum sp. 352 TaxID=2490946 RepID=UPI0013DF7428|nr:LppA family lipoprotein [Actinobaculum sp. 352]